MITLIIAHHPHLTIVVRRSIRLGGRKTNHDHDPPPKLGSTTDQSIRNFVVTSMKSMIKPMEEMEINDVKEK